MNDTRIDKRLHDIEDEVKLLSGYISDAVGASLDTRLGVITKRIDALKSLPADSKNAAVQVLPDPELFASVHDELKAMHDAMEKRISDLDKRIEGMQPAPIDAGKIAGQMPSYGKDFSAVQDTLKTLSGTIGGKIDSLGKQIETMRQQDPGIETIVEQLPKHQESFTQLHGGIKSLDASVTQARDAVGERVSGDLKRTAAEIAAGLKRTSEEIAAGLEALGVEVKTVGEVLPAISDQMMASRSAQADLQKEIAGSSGRLENQLDTLTGDFKSVSDMLRKDISRNGDVVQNISQRIGQKQDESAAKLLKELQTVRENSEVLRRMCTTDEEKFLGTMTTAIFNRTAEMTGEVTKLFNSVKKWFASLDENQRRAAEKILDRQDEMKKSLLFDINKMSETVHHIDTQVSHDKKRPIGAEIIRTGDKVAAIEEIMPDIQGNVAAINEQLAEVSKQVRTMRWFVVAAVGISIAVLAASFYFWFAGV